MNYFATSQVINTLCLSHFIHNICCWVLWAFAGHLTGKIFSVSTAACSWKKLDILSYIIHLFSKSSHSCFRVTRGWRSIPACIRWKKDIAVTCRWPIQHFNHLLLEAWSTQIMYSHWFNYDATSLVEHHVCHQALRVQTNNNLHLFEHILQPVDYADYQLYKYNSFLFSLTIVNLKEYKAETIEYKWIKDLWKPGIVQKVIYRTKIDAAVLQRMLHSFTHSRANTHSSTQSARLVHSKSDLGSASLFDHS